MTSKIYVPIQCPFCASPHSRIEKNVVGRTTMHYEYYVTCEYCGAVGPTDLGESGAVEMWNLRRTEFPKPYTTETEGA